LYININDIFWVNRWYQDQGFDYGGLPRIRPTALCTSAHHIISVPYRVWNCSKRRATLFVARQFNATAPLKR